MILDHLWSGKKVRGASGIIFQATMRWKQFFMPSNSENRKYNLNRATVHKGKHRDTVENSPSTPKTIHATLSPLEEHIAVELAPPSCCPGCPVGGRPGIHTPMSRALASSENDTGEQRPENVKRFKQHEPGYVHVDVKYPTKIPDEKRRNYLVVAIDQASRGVFLQVTANTSASNTAQRFLYDLVARPPFRISKILTDNHKEFSDRSCATGDRKPTSNPSFRSGLRPVRDRNRLIRPRRFQTNGMVERFNNPIQEILQGSPFRFCRKLREALFSYCLVYNYHITQRNIVHITKDQFLKKTGRNPRHIFSKK